MTGAVVERVVDWQDTDAAGHYHHSTVIRWVEAAEAVLLASLGQRELFGRIPRVRYEVDYRNRIWFGDVASTELWVDRVGGSSVRYGFVVTGKAAGQPDTVVAEGTMTAVHAPDSAGSSPWPPEIAAALRGAGKPQPRRTGEQSAAAGPISITEEWG